MVLNPATNTFEPEKADPGLVVVSANSCSIWDLAMWPAGRITGTVRDGNLKPLNGVTVQGFAFDTNNNRESSPLRTAKTASDGTFSLEPLPPGNYAVGVNANLYKDEDAYPPTLYLDGRGTYLAESATQNGIDIVLPPARVAAKLRTTVLGPDSRPYPDATIRLDNLAGVQRWFTRNKSDENGEITLPVYVGERYVVRAFNYSSDGNFEGAAQIEVVDASPSAVVVLHRKERTK